MSEYHDKLMEEAKELERAAKEEHKIALMTPEVKRAYFYGKSLEAESIYWGVKEQREKVHEKIRWLRRLREQEIIYAVGRKDG